MEERRFSPPARKRPARHRCRCRPPVGGGSRAQLPNIALLLTLSFCLSGITYDDGGGAALGQKQAWSLFAWVSLPVVFVGGQFMEGTSQFNYFVNLGKSKLGKQIQYHPDLVSVFFPELLMINRDIYREEIPKTTSTVFGAGQDYVINVIFDPCRGHPADCCNGLYGTPEYIKLENTTSQVSLNRFGSEFGVQRSRLGDRILKLDDVCSGKERPFRVVDGCLGCLDPPYAGYEKGSTVLPFAMCPDAVRKHCAVNSGIYSGEILDTDLIDRDTFPAVPTDMYTNQLNGQRRDFQILCRVMSTRCRYDRNRVCEVDPLGKPEGCRYCRKCDFNAETNEWDLNCKQKSGQSDPPRDDWVSNVLDGVLTGPEDNTVSRQTEMQLAVCNDAEECGPANQGYSCVDAAMLPSDTNSRNDGQGCQQMTISEEDNMCKGSQILDEKGRDTGLWTGLDPPCITTCRKIDIWRRDCVRPRVSLVQEQMRPRCWDYNDTVPGDQACYDVTGAKQPYCVAMAISIDAMVHQCSGFQGQGPFLYDWHCGTYLEVHLPSE